MKKTMWWFAVLAVLAAPAAAQMKTQPLFIIERSKNANVVHYDARLTADGKLDLKAAAIAYWVLLSEEVAGRNSAESKRKGFTVLTSCRIR